MVPEVEPYEMTDEQFDDFEEMEKKINAEVKQRGSSGFGSSNKN
jgi:hypothetical protein